jgi:uncharacterized 2Fe-2S/4Fe-4S cluster protein (DUF4445 family)
VSGAIERISLKETGDVEYKTINGGKPRGICGSGMVDLLAELFVHGIIDRQGKFIKDKKHDRIYNTEGQPAFLIEESSRCHWEKELFLTEKDIASLIRTKGAVFSACSLLLKNAGLNFDNIDSFYIAGGFGRHLNIHNAICIGLLPDMDQNRFFYIGNSSLHGAYLILLSDKNLDIADQTAEKMTYIELNTTPDYMNEFTGAMFLPHTDLKLFPSAEKNQKKYDKI